MNQKITIEIPALKAMNPEVVKAIETIAKVIDVDNLLKVKQKCEAKPDSINKSLKTGLSFI